MKSFFQKSFAILALSVLLFITLFASSRREAVGDLAGGFESQEVGVFPIRKGINLTNWFAQGTNDELALDSSLTHADIDVLVRNGVDHVRIPVDESYLFDEKGTPYKGKWEILKDRMDYFAQNGIRMVFDLHQCRVHQTEDKSKDILFESKEGRRHLLKVWKLLQKQLRRYPTDILAYECLNEPQCPLPHHERWNELLADWISSIRRQEPERVLFCGTSRGNQIWTLKFLELPADSNLVLTIHYYQPMALTHYKCTWYRLKDYKGSVRYPGETVAETDFLACQEGLRKLLEPYTKQFDKTTIYNDFNTVRQWGAKHAVQVNLGEFGCQSSVPDEYRRAYLSDITDVCRELGFSYTLWGHKTSGFGIYLPGKKLNTRMLEAIKITR